MKKIAFVFGTRPEIIKLSPIIKQIKNPLLIHTGQHYSKNLSDSIFHDLRLKVPKYNLRIKEKSQVRQVAKMMLKIEDVLIKEKPDWVVVLGDTNSTLAGAMVASKLNIRLLHIESGARSFNRAEPEEVIRVMVDHLANINVAFSKESQSNLKQEGIVKNILNFPNTVYEACHNQTKYLKRKIMKDYILITIHRATNTNDPIRLQNIANLLNDLSEKYILIFPMHPRTQRLLKIYKIKLSDKVKVIDPQGYNDFLSLIKFSRGVISDSGGVVDESAYFQKRLIIFRNETERIDIIKNGTAILVSPDLDNKVQHKMIRRFLNKTIEPRIPQTISSISAISKNIVKNVKW